ncbi:hypothetical protein [Streptomyces sp. NPDC001315]|uniref:hypothetical protein n=1 Tax=Streptomyces sp. NPDC001315 TaxID=3364562 RepID=UPI0036C9093C
MQDVHEAVDGQTEVDAERPCGQGVGAIVPVTPAPLGSGPERYLPSSCRYRSARCHDASNSSAVTGSPGEDCDASDATPNVDCPYAEAYSCPPSVPYSSRSPARSGAEKTARALPSGPKPASRSSCPSSVTSNQRSAPDSPAPLRNHRVTPPNSPAP